MSERDEFEEWAAEEAEVRGVGALIGLMQDEHHDRYSMIWTQTAWMAWKASRTALLSNTKRPVEFKNTPGPWRIGTPGPNGCYTIGTERGLMTAVIAHSINEPDQAVAARADAKLIAAAPDLLRCLKEIVDGAWPSAVCWKARAAISKATE